VTTIQQRIGQSRSRVATYLAADFDRIEGWCSPTTAAMMAELLWFQESDGVPGGIAEIGIHHGKSFLVMALAARPEDRKFAVDVFGMQERNVDDSGKGDRGIFEAYLREYAADCDVDVLEMDSLDLRGREADFGFKGLRFLSIDGGHTIKATANDLHIADRALRPDGICVVDDLLNPHWTGVVSGVFAFMSRSASLVPVALIPNKLVMSRPAHRSRILAFMRSAFARSREKSDLELGTGLIDVFGEFPGYHPAEPPAVGGT